MNANRRKGSQRSATFARRALGAGLLVLGLAFAAPGPGLTQSGTLSEAILTDTLTGAALMGYDPVAYHIDDRATKGSPEHQLALAGRVWMFRNAGNRAAFAEQPDAYVPGFGGYDPTGVARGRIVPGNPVHFLIVGGKLFLFRDASTRAAVVSDPEVLAAAAVRWPEVKRQLVP